MTRRRFAGALIASAAPALVRAEASSALRTVASAKGLLVGTAVSPRQLARPEFAAVLAKEANIVVSENSMKWGPLRPTPETFDFADADQLVAFARTHDQRIRGHNLCWHEMLPRWFNSVVTTQNAGQTLRRHIATVAGRYAGKIQSWDVVNEAIHVEDGRPDGLRNSPWLRLIGPDYLAIAFRAARDADPHAVLTYNDYDLEQDTPANEAKRQAVLKMLRGLREHDVPVQALGIQAHLKSGLPSQWTGFGRFLRAVEALKLQIFVTELDIDDRAFPGDIPARDADVAALYRDFLKVLLPHPSVKAILTWGLTDRDTWLNSYLPRQDKLPQRPLPLDAELQRKPAYDALFRALQAASSR